MRTTDVLKALADETRLDIILFLMSGRRNAGQIVSKIKKSQPNISLALKQLLITGIIDQEKEGREVYCHIRKPELMRSFLELLEQLQKFMRTTDVLKALADETRLDIILFLMSGRRNAGQIVSKIKKSQPNISLALKQLLITGIIDQEKEGREVYCHIRKPELMRSFLELLEQLQK